MAELTDTPEERIRRFLDERGRPTRIPLRKLLDTFGLHAPTAADRRTMTEALSRVGVAVEPAIEAIEDGDTVVVVRPQDAGDAPVVQIPGELPQALLAAGAGLLVVALFMPWYSAQRDGVVVPDLDTGWQWLHVLDVYLLLVAAAAAALVPLVGRPGPARGLLADGLSAMSVVGLLLVVYRIGSPPGDAVPGFALETHVRIGPFAAALALAAILGGARLVARARPAAN